MPYVDIVTALALIQFIVFGIKVGRARGKYGVQAPACTGNDIFERHYRVQQNTLELLIALVPGLYLFSRYIDPVWAAGLGVVYLIGREVYAAAYVRNPAKRGAGYALSALPTLMLLLGSVIGAVRHLIQH